MVPDINSMLHLRLNNQLIAPKSIITSPDTIISHFGAIQAQDYQGAKWSIGLRTKNVTNEGIEQAIKEGKIVRTWLMRGTLFFVHSNDLGWILKLVAPKIISAVRKRNLELGLDTQTLVRCLSIIEKAFDRQTELSRPALMAIIGNSGISTEGYRAAHILQFAAFNGLICQTNSVKNVPNYILTRNLSIKEKEYSREEAISELAKRYFTSRGPATIQDFVWWSGLTVTEARSGVESLKFNLGSVSFNDQVYWYYPVESDKTEDSDIWLLPGFDEFLLGYKERSFSLDKVNYSHWCPGNNGMFMPFMLKNGKVTGIWKRNKQKLSFQYFEKRNSKNPSISSCINKYSNYLSMELSIENPG